MSDMDRVQGPRRSAKRRREALHERGVNVSSGSSHGKSTDMTPPEYRALRGPLAGWLTGALQGGPAYQGPYAASMTPDETANLARVNAFAGSNPSGASRGMLTDTVQGAYLTPESNPFLRQYIDAAQRPVTEAFNEASLGDRASFTAAGHRVGSSSPFAYARALADRGLANSLGDVSTRIAGQAYEGERGRQVEAAGQLSSVNQEELNRQVEALRVSALPRLIQQMGIDKGMEEFQRRIDLALKAAGISQGASVVLGQNTKSSQSGIGVLG